MRSLEAVLVIHSVQSKSFSDGDEFGIFHIPADSRGVSLIPVFPSSLYLESSPIHLYLVISSLPLHKILHPATHDPPPPPFLSLPPYW